MVTLNFFLVKYYFSEKLKTKLLIVGVILLLSLWIGLFLETPEMEHGTLVAIIITSTFLSGLSIFLMLFFEVFSEKFYSLPKINYHYYALQPVFLNLFCLLNSIFILFISINIQIKLIITSLLAHLVVMSLHVSFYNKIYNKIVKVPLRILFSIYLFFALVSLLYFAIGFMALFVLTPFNVMDLK